jgi:uncharacterized protein YjbI with pentapeptide repeats
MTNTPTPLDPIAQLVAKYQSNGHQTVSTKPQTTPQAQQKEDWTGFRGKTLWDWLQLLGIIAIPFVVVLASNALTFQQQQATDAQHKIELSIADDQRQEATLKAYLDDMTSLLLNNRLRDSHPGDEVRKIALIKTLTVVRQLNGSRKGLLLKFLIEASLLDNKKPIVLLNGADLSGTISHQYEADQYGANLSGANLSGANLQAAYLPETDLSRTNLSHADLLNADLPLADLSLADLSFVNLSRADLSHADLLGTLLFRTNLQGTKVTPKQLAEARSLKGATLPDGSLYPSSSYPIPNHQEPTN